MQATAYCQTGQTSSGVAVKRGIVAADPRVIPQGATIRVESSLHRYTGTYLVADTGAMVKGRIIDIYVPDCAAARRFGRRRVTVTILQIPAEETVATR